MIACTMKNLKDATSIDARNEGLKGEGSAPGLSGYSFVLIIAIFAVGCLPKELGDLVSLKYFDISQNWIEGQLSIRTERFVCMFC